VLVSQHPLPDPHIYDDRTWEYVVHEGQLISAVNFGGAAMDGAGAGAGAHVVGAGITPFPVWAALFFEERAKTAREPAQQMALRQAAINVYTHLMNATVFDGYRPAFWHKNFGLSAYGARRGPGDRHGRQSHTAFFSPSISAEQFQQTSDKALLPIVRQHWRLYIERCGARPALSAAPVFVG
jgi:hypothetical protein